jgi:hypothetical protein
LTVPSGRGTGRTDNARSQEHVDHSAVHC